MKQTFARDMFKFTMLVGPFLVTIILGEMYKLSPTDDFISYVVIGSGMWNLWNSIVFSSAGDIQRERYSNTLSIIFSAPADFRMILLGKVLGNTFLATMSFFLSVFFAIILYRPPININNYMFAVFAFVLLIIVFIVMSVVMAYLLTLSRKTTIFMNCLEIPFALICGFVFPIENLPVGVQYLSLTLPPTWAVRLLRYSIVASSYTFWGLFVPLMVTTVVFVILSNVLYRIIFKQTKILGTLDMA